MSDGEIQTEVTQMTVGKGLGIYAVLLVGLLILIKLASAISWFPGVIPCCAYFVFGFIMNRLVLRDLIEWPPMYNTTQNISSSTRRAFIFWPISYLMLFFQLSVAKHL